MKKYEIVEKYENKAKKIVLDKNISYTEKKTY